MWTFQRAQKDSEEMRPFLCEQSRKTALECRFKCRHHVTNESPLSPSTSSRHVSKRADLTASPAAGRETSKDVITSDHLTQRQTLQRLQRLQFQARIQGWFTPNSVGVPREKSSLRFFIFARKHLRRMELINILDSDG